jgi:cell division inhibitor SulA
MDAVRTNAATLDALLSAQTVWKAGRAPVSAAGGEPSGHAALDALLPQGGWPRRALTELLLPADGVGELALLMPTLARLTRAGSVVAVVAPPYLPYAPAWQAGGVDLGFLEIIDADARNGLWAFEQCLRSAACGAVLGWPLHADAPALRRLQVAADSGDCLGFAFRDRRHAVNPSPAALRLEHLQGAWHVRKCRGGNLPSRAVVLETTHVGPFVGAASAASFCRESIKPEKLAAEAAPTVGVVSVEKPAAALPAC